MSRLISVSIFTLMTATAALAQTNQELTVGELQKQLDEMRSQMVKMQNRFPGAV